MNKNIKNQEIPAWDEIEKRVLEPFDLNDIGVRLAVATWRKNVEKIRAGQNADEIAHYFTSPEVLDPVVEFLQSELREDIAVSRVKLARNEHVMKLMNLRVVLGQTQGVFVDEENGERIVPKLLAVVRVTKSAETKKLRELIQASRTLANNTGDDKDEQPSWPSGLGEGIQDFADDLKEFISTNGDQGREMVSLICQDPGFAKTVSKDAEMPQCIKFLTQIVVETNTSNHLPEKVRQIGFGATGR